MIFIDSNIISKSLRLQPEPRILGLPALEMRLDHATPLPFIADDLFINYDEARSRAGLEALGKLSERTKVIFLSHHDHLIPEVRAVFGDRVNIVAL